ncbi:choice-of-anchor Q domain-containing protein, partial [Psychroserpens damuponensis]|uniref:choice-of-anchor Q domain-containing protein n=1 Tax=Psychroserpens damuponensis TaxID=943936 RepID=UPI0019D3522E
MSKTRLLLILLFIGSYTFGQTWNQVGAAQFTNDGADVALALSSSNVPYVAYSDTTVDGKVHVEMFDGTNWVEVGTNVSPAIVPVKLAIAINPITGYPWVSYKDTSTNRQVVKKYDGTNWVLDTADVFGYEPLSKVQLKFDANGDATIAATFTHSLQYRETLRVKRKNNGETSWANDFSIVVTSRSFDLVTANKIAAGETGVVSSSEKRYIYEYISNAWTSTYNTAGAATVFNDGVMASDDNKIIYNAHNGGNPLLTGENGMSTPPNNQNTKERVHQLIYNPFSYNHYAFYIQSNYALRVVENNFYTNTWSDISPGLTMQTNSSAKIELSQDGTTLFIAYMDANKVSVKSYDINLPLATIYVDANATGTNDGSSWANALTDIQTAIDITTPGLSEIWVAQGIYTTGSSRADTFLITELVKLYGGFNGTETDITQRDPKTNVTVLSGDLNGDDSAILTNVEATRQDNAYHVVTLKGNFNSGTIIDGFTISGANANGALSNSCSTPATQQYAHDRGGAVYANPDNANRSVSALFNNCIIEKNTSSKIAVFSTFSPCGASGTFSDVDFENCIIRDNYSVGNQNLDYGASGTYSNSRYGSLINCAIYNNESVNAASVVRLSASGGNGSVCRVNIINTTITKNSSGINKAMSLNNVSYCKIQNSIIYDNDGFQPIEQSGNAPTSNNNIVQGAQLSGNPSDPLFTNSTANDFTLQSISPAVDAGNVSYMPSHITTDVLGHARVYNTDIDMGAYEYNPTLGVSNVTGIDNQIKLYPNPAISILN